MTEVERTLRPLLILRGRIVEQYLPAISRPSASWLAPRLSRSVHSTCLKPRPDGVVTRELAAADACDRENTHSSLAVTCRPIPAQIARRCATQPFDRVNGSSVRHRADARPDAAITPGVPNLPEPRVPAIRVQRLATRAASERVRRPAPALRRWRAVSPTIRPDFLARTPHGYHRTDEIVAALRQAGFTDVSADTVTRRSVSPSCRDPAIGFCQGTPLRNESRACATLARLAAATVAAAARISARFGKRAGVR